VERMQVAHGGGRDEQDELGLGVLGFQVLRPLDRLRAGCGLVGDDELAGHRTLLPLGDHPLDLRWLDSRRG
jgi:hypothetical protein